MADAPDSRSGPRNGVRVQVPPLTLPTCMVKPSHVEAPMLQWILCENEHARLPDAWELSTAANEVGSCFACGAAARLQPIPAEEQREVLSGSDVPGHYILRPLAWARGAGVYQARQAKSRRLVALKVSRLGSDAAQERASVRREAAILRKLDHPGIVAFFEAGERNGRAFFSMEWLAGPQLGERLRDGPLRPREAIRMAARLADAIHYMHCRRFIYGELRPSNIVFSGRGVAKLVDFESAMRRDRRGRAAPNGGDPRYVAPSNGWGKTRKSVRPRTSSGSVRSCFMPLPASCLSTGSAVMSGSAERALFRFPRRRHSVLRCRRLWTRSAASVCSRNRKIGTLTRASWQTTCDAFSRT